MNVKHIKIFKTILLSVFAIFSVATFFILPSGDDWWCSCPDENWNWSYLFPNNAYGNIVPGLWRPFPILIRYLLSYTPQLYPFFDHLLTIVFYALSAFMIDKICKLLSMNEKSRLCVLAFMLFAPISMATFLSVDGFGQSASTFFGLWSVMAFCKNKRFSRYWKWIALVLIGTFFKESGIVWFVATPVIAFIIEKKEKIFEKSFVKDILIGSCVVLLYFVARAILMQDNVDVFTSDYQLNLSVQNIIKAFALILGGCVTSADTIALLLSPRNYPIAIITSLLGLPVLLYFIRLMFAALKNKELRKKYLLFGFLIICVTSPHLITTCATEMYSYATIPIVALMCACLSKDVDNQNDKFVTIALICYFAAAFFVDAHKYVCMYNNGLKGRDLALKINSITKPNPNNVLILNVVTDEPYYSVYCHPYFVAYGRGYATLHLNKYKYPKHVSYLYVNEIDDYEKIIEKYCEYHNNVYFDNIWILNKDDVKIYRSETK